jgi:ketosteroid isomerase-like protein
MSTQLAEAWFAAFRGKDIAELERLLTEDFAHTSPFGEIKPRQAYLDLVRANPQAFFSPVIELQDIFDCGDKVAVRYLVNDSPACDCIYARDGQIAEIFSYYHYGEKPTM